MSDAQTPVSPTMEKALSEIRFLLSLAESHPAGIKSIQIVIREHDGARMDMRQDYDKPRPASRPPTTKGLF